MTIDNLISRLDKVKSTGKGKWLACCPAHSDKTPSLAVRQTDDERILLHCFAGCSVESVLGAVGMDFADLHPEPLTHNAKPERRPYPAADVLRCIAFESLVVFFAATNISTGIPLPQTERDRLLLAVTRIQTALRLSGVNL